MKAHPDHSGLYVSTHPLIISKLSHMRDSACGKRDFCRYLKEITWLLAYEVTKDFSLRTMPITTPVDKMDAPMLKDPLPVIVPILRAGLGMLEGLQDIMPDALIGHIGLYRDEETKKPVEYLVNLPDKTDYPMILADPMLATGHSAEYAIKMAIEAGYKEDRIKLLCLVAAPEGVKTVLAAYPDVHIYTAALDEKLNSKAYITPGLGDAGDRLFGTL